MVYLVEDGFEVGDWLPGLPDQVLDVVVLVLLEEVEQGLHDFLFVVSGLFALRLHLLGVGDVGGVVRHRLERLDQLVDLLDFAGSLCRLQQGLTLQLKWINQVK